MKPPKPTYESKLCPGKVFTSRRNAKRANRKAIATARSVLVKELKHAAKKDHVRALPGQDEKVEDRRAPLGPLVPRDAVPGSGDSVPGSWNPPATAAEIKEDLEKICEKVLKW